MEINEKLDIFFQAAIDAAREQSEAIQEEYRNAYEDALVAYEKEKQDSLALRERTQEEKIRKEINRAMSEKLMQLKRDYHDMENWRKEELFSLVQEKISVYRKTEAYRKHLANMIHRAKDFAAGEEIKIYLDPADAPFLAELNTEPETEWKKNRKKGCTLLISEEAFGGGIRAVISGKNLLLDESFGRRLDEEREKLI